MALIVQKFGGTSVGSIEKIQRVAKIITDTVEQGNHVVTVVSAMGHSTDALVEMAKQINPDPSGREYDALLATGEMVTTSLLAMTLNSMGYPAVGFNGGQAGVKTEDLHNRARILEINTQNLQQQLGNNTIVIVTGFQGLDSTGNITTLGRGGSDTSAVALAGALKADRCDIYTDVTGVYSTDPRVVKEAVKLDRVTYIEMMELARVGAQVLHPRAVETAKHGNVKLCVRSTFELDNPGTLIVGVQDMETQRSVVGVACDNDQARIAMVGVPDRPGIAAEIFGSLANNNVSVDMIIQSLSHKDGGEAPTNDIAFTVNADELNEAMKVLTDVQAQINATDLVVDDGIAKVSIVGAGMVDRPGIAADMFKSLAAAGINIRMIATSEIKISCLVDKDQANHAIQVIHDIFFPEAAGAKPALVDKKLGY
ncbi:MAG: aspartate kinase [Vampirovibrio sp.]|nr:aspartate kinase [Vampirovibrio sp.]